MGNTWALHAHPEVTPKCDTDPKFDPNVGFPSGRKPREMIVTKEELMSAKVPLEHRDYCAHKALQYLTCRADVWPMAYKCSHERHDYFTCQYEDYVLRMKEYERERRLMVREQRIQKQTVA